MDVSKNSRKPAATLLLNIYLEGLGDESKQGTSTNNF